MNWLRFKKKKKKAVVGWDGGVKHSICWSNCQFVPATDPVCLPQMVCPGICIWSSKIDLVLCLREINSWVKFRVRAGGGKRKSLRKNNLYDRLGGISFRIRIWSLWLWRYGVRGKSRFRRRGQWAVGGNRAISSQDGKFECGSWRELPVITCMITAVHTRQQTVIVDS